jgi:HD-GYP domain-containing protein (c-di-GMP phosphodiesterase class II)
MSAAAARAPEYQAIRIKSLSSEAATTFDTYIQVGSRYVLYCRNGDTFDGERLERLKQKSITELFILKIDIPAYERYIDRNAIAAYEHTPGMTIEQRAEKILKYNHGLIERFFRSPQEIDTYLELKNSSRRFIDFVCNEPQSLKALLDIPNADLNIPVHGVRVAAISTALAHSKNMVDNNRPVHLMVLGAFLHDLQFFESDFDYRRPLSALSKEDLKEYRKHPSDGAQKIQTIGHVDILVTQIIVQHEEHADGTGFPKGLHSDDMDPSVLLVGAANVYDRLVTFEAQTPKDALKNLLIDKMGAYELTLLQQLQSMLKSRGIVG